MQVWLVMQNVWDGDDEGNGGYAHSVVHVASTMEGAEIECERRENQQKIRKDWDSPCYSVEGPVEVDQVQKSWRDERTKASFLRAHRGQVSRLRQLAGADRFKIEPDSVGGVDVCKV